MQVVKRIPAGSVRYVMPPVPLCFNFCCLSELKAYSIGQPLRRRVRKKVVVSKVKRVCMRKSHVLFHINLNTVPRSGYWGVIPSGDIMHHRLMYTSSPVSGAVANAAPYETIRFYSE